ncbi:MAG: FAD-dependent oxidoreductase [Canidatus Methanoxibalbensis ujae]|nr:FAD-dependent oxidoreductase [Candidatus Methanoxibalbensis ujae]
MVTERFAYFKRFEMDDLTIDREIPRCISACPAGCDVRGYIKLIAERRYEDAYELIQEKVTLPATIGRICYHPCEIACRRAFYDEPVAIAALKRFVGDMYLSSRSNKSQKKTENISEGSASRAESGAESGKRVAVIGAGPAGLTAAYRLAKKGHSVRIFERLPVAGGMLVAGIPPYRLPRDVLRRDIEYIKKAGVEIVCGVDVDEEMFRRICEEYDAVFVSVGAHRSRVMGIEGEDKEGVFNGVDFLRDFNIRNINPVNGKRVVVVGGGNVAIDVARTSLRAGARDVTIVYRRSREEMPAREEEVKEAEEEGVKFIFLANPIRIIGERRVEKIELIRMKLGEKDEKGRRKPFPVKGSEFMIDADIFITAIGQESDLSFLNGSGVPRDKFIKTDENGYTGVKNIFAGGDCVRGPAFAIDAIADANRVAEAIHSMLTRGKIEVFDESVGAVFAGTGVAGATPVSAVPEEAEQHFRNELWLEASFGAIRKESRREMPVLAADERVRGFSEICLGLSEEDALAESDRCLRCRSCMLSVGRGAALMDVHAVSYAVEGVARGVNKCAECGECTAICPVTAIEPLFSPRKIAGISLMEQTRKLLDEDVIWLCVSCGVCNAICPYGVDFVGFMQNLRKFAFLAGNVPHYENGKVSAVEIGKGSEGKSETAEREKRESRGEHIRFKWLHGHNAKVAEEGDVYYFAGCLSLLSSIYAEREELRLEEIARSAVRLLNEVGVVPAISMEERCCGHDILWAGDEERFKELMRANIAAIKKSGAKVVVFTCAECLRTFEIDYRRFAAEEGIEMGFKCMHISEFLIERSEAVAKKAAEKRSDIIITYHDPCRLRHLRIYEQPRELLRMIAEVREMEHHRERGLCCGVGSMITCGAVARVMQAQRLDEAERTGAEKLVVACPKCWIHFDCAVSALGRKIRIEDFTITIANALLKSGNDRNLRLG